jgi:hypothetical protein
MSPDIWPLPGYLPRKYDFSSIFRVPVIQIEHIRARLKGLSARIVLSSRF